MNIVPQCDVDPSVHDSDLRNVLSASVCGRYCHSSFDASRGRHAVISESINDRDFCTRGHIDRLSDLSAHRVGLVRRHREGRQYSDDRHDDHEFD